jgi:hypothetical protein
MCRPAATEALSTPTLAPTSLKSANPIVPFQDIQRTPTFVTKEAVIFDRVGRTPPSAAVDVGVDFVRVGRTPLSDAFDVDSLFWKDSGSAVSSRTLLVILRKRRSARSAGLPTKDLCICYGIRTKALSTFVSGLRSSYNPPHQRGGVFPMLESLGQAVQNAAHPGGSRVTLDAIDKIVKIVAVILGGVWTYLNYVRGRTFRRRLEPKISGKIASGVDIGTWMVAGMVQAKNVGLSKVDIEASGTAIVIEDMVLGASKKGIPKIVEVEIVGGVLGVFKRHRWIEPGETIEESFAAPLPVRSDRTGVRLWLRIVSRHKIFKNIEWNADSIAELPQPLGGGSPATTAGQGSKVEGSASELGKAIR